MRSSRRVGTSLPRHGLSPFAAAYLTRLGWGGTVGERNLWSSRERAISLAGREVPVLDTCPPHFANCLLCDFELELTRGVTVQAQIINHLALPIACGPHFLCRPQSGGHVTAQLRLTIHSFVTPQRVVYKWSLWGRWMFCQTTPPVREISGSSCLHSSTTVEFSTRVYRSPRPRVLSFRGPSLKVN